jgi:exosortase/archaeosortase family protein
MNSEKIKSALTSDVGMFILKVVGIYVVWYIVYELWVLPNGWVDDPLSMNIAGVSAGILSFLGEDIFYYGRVVGITGAAGIEIVNGCNGIAAIGLFLGFIYAYPGESFPRFAFSIIGIGVIYIVNIARIVVLAYTQIHIPSMFQVTHDYSTTAIFYITIFVMWMIWVNISDKGFKTKPPVPAAA